jgi:putative methyltransferase (TIGR04325 family)
MNQLIKSFIPPILLNVIKRFRKRKYGWVGNYTSWESAQADSTGYDSSVVLEKVKNSLLKVKSGDAVFERDSVLFDEIQYSWPLLSSLLVSGFNHAELRVLDFGGSLGSTYFQYKKFLSLIENVSWSVVEQAGFVTVGKELFEDEHLKFFYNIDECMAFQKPNVLLFSSVLQYIDEPYKLLDKILASDIEFVAIDRMPFIYEDNDQIKVQKVPPSIYSASYPCWFFSESSFIEHYLKNGYKLIESIASLEGNSRDCMFKGMIFKRD